MYRAFGRGCFIINKPIRAPSGFYVNQRYPDLLSRLYLRNLMRIEKLAFVFVNGLLLISLTGCVSTSWLANKIVRPAHQVRLDGSFKTVASPLYSETIILPVHAPDAGTVVASVVEPADYVSGPVSLRILLTNNSGWLHCHPFMASMGV